MEADYVIVGGGSAGCVLANRLSADPATRVLLLEAGGNANSPLVKMPAGMAKLIAQPASDWCYESERDASIGGRRFLWSAGKMLGGGSSINGQVYIRGLRSDYDRWAAAGCDGWSFDAVLPYFKRGERYEDRDAPPSHGRDGELSVSEVRSPHPLLTTFLSACNERGLPTLNDYCGGEQFGVFRTLATQRDGQRCSAHRAFVEPVASRPNLTVLTGCHVQQILFEGTTAVGVRVRRGGSSFDVRAHAEVIVSAGTIGSPSLLMRSGVGDAAALKDVGIQPVVVSAQVGQNLQEHPGVAVSKQVNVPTYNSAGPLALMGEAMRYLFARNGMMTTPAVQAMAFIKTQPALADPDVQMHFLPLCYEVTPETMCSATATMPKTPAMMIMTNVCRPNARGHVRLRAADPEQMPIIEHPMLGDERDVATLVRACRFAEDIFASDALRSVVTGPFVPPSPPPSDAAWSDYVRAKSVPCYHPVGTCRMGSDADAVVDPQLKVRGAQRLRVVDASVMPTLLSANTNAATMMIAERAVEWIAAH